MDVNYYGSGWGRSGRCYSSDTDALADEVGVDVLVVGWVGTHSLQFPDALVIRWGPSRRDTMVRVLVVEWVGVDLLTVQAGAGGRHQMSLRNPSFGPPQP